MRFVFKEQQPVLCFAVDGDGDLDRAGVDLFRLVEPVKLAGFFQRLDRNGTEIHQGDGLFVSDAFAQGEILVKCRGELGILKFHLVKYGMERRVAAVVGPIGVDQTQLGDGGVALLRCEVIAAAAQIALVHGKAVFPAEGGQFLFRHRAKALEHRDGIRCVVLFRKGVDRLQRGLAAFDGVDDIAAHRRKFLVGQIAVQQIDAGGAYQRTLSLRKQLNALRRGIGTLIVLPGQIFHRKAQRAVFCGQGIIGEIDLRLGKDGRHRALKQSGLDMLDVIAVEQTKAGERMNSQKGTQILGEGLRLLGEFRFFFHINAVNQWKIPPLVKNQRARSARAPMSRRQ